MDISLVGPGAYGGECEPVSGGGRDAMYMERMTTDMTALKMQYDKLRLRQRQAHVIIAGQSTSLYCETLDIRTTLVPVKSVPISGS